jgi:hypothetical protein
MESPDCKVQEALGPGLGTMCRDSCGATQPRHRFETCLLRKLDSAAELVSSRWNEREHCPARHVERHSYAPTVP